MRNNRFFPTVKLDFRELVGEEVKSIESIRAEFGRTYDTYLLITCESGKRILMYGGNPYDPNPKLEQMRETTFFTPGEIAERILWDESVKRRKIKEEDERKRREYENLKRQLGLD